LDYTMNKKYLANTKEFYVPSLRTAMIQNQKYIILNTVKY